MLKIMEPHISKQFYILIGRSGGGKGTQADLLRGYLESRGHQNVTHITTGGSFRDFIREDNHVARLAKSVNETGGLQPEFLAVWNWSNIFITKLKGDETVILDGAPRKPFEVSVLHSAISFLGYHKPIVIYLDVSESVARGHIKGRGRSDDMNIEDVSSRMNWFETDVLPALEMYKNDPRYSFVHINGNQAIEEVYRELVEKIEKIQ
jgi:adenylate kinase family enzyme